MKGFTIYREYFDLITLLPKKEQGELMLAICSYMFLNTIPNLNESQMKIFRNLKRPLDKSKNKGKNSSKSNSNENQIEIETEPESNQNENETNSNKNQNGNKIETHQDGSVNVYVNVFNSLKELVNYIQKELNYILNNSNIEINTLKLWLDNKVPKEIIKYSFEEARRKNKNDINYINGIVNKRFEEFKKKQEEEKLPEWFDKKIEKNTEGLEELESVLKDFN